MKLLWLCNSPPGVVRSHMTGKEAGAVNWVDHVLAGLRQQGVTLRILCRGQDAQGVLDDRCSYRCFGEETAHEYHPEQEEWFRQELRDFQPDVIHSWGVEYGHTLAMVKAAEAEGLLPKMAASIQGLCAVLAEHYTDGIPEKAARKRTFRDLVRKDDLLAQKEKFALRGRMEREAVQALSHVIGRTGWDRTHTIQWNPEVTYHFCNETLREPFYQGQWSYDECRKHRIFASSCSYPIKGFHYLLEAFGEVVKTCPDAALVVTGRSFLAPSLREKLRQGSYETYLSRLVKKYGLEKNIVFLGNLSAEQMKRQYLEANLFVLPSSMENSPNSLGEAMLLGTPCVAADVGGVRDLMGPEEGLIYAPGDVAALTAAIRKIFALENDASLMGLKARCHARKTHDPQTNLRTLTQIYETLM